MAYLDAWLVDAPDDASGIARAPGDMARAKGMTQVAKDAGMSCESLYNHGGVAASAIMRHAAQEVRAIESTVSIALTPPKKSPSRSANPLLTTRT